MGLVNVLKGRVRLGKTWEDREGQLVEVRKARYDKHR